MNNLSDTDLDLHNFQPTRDDFLEGVLAGLRKSPKRLPPKYFYDDRGCRLFDQICELDEYYPTRTELAVMEQYIDRMTARIGPGAALIEYGSGSSIKTRLLLDKLPDLAVYAPVEIARDHLQRTAEAINRRYPRLQVEPICADFTQPFDLPESALAARRRVIYFPGSTLGNFEPSQAQRILRQIAAEVGPGGGLLIGLDLRKSPAVLEAAYNDARGVTAQFNLNLLVRINRELNADFNLDQWRHKAFYNQSAHRIEMHLESQTDQTAQVAGEQFEFAKGETICTEYSHKYDLQQFASTAAEAGLQLVEDWTDEREYFAVVYLETFAA